MGGKAIVEILNEQKHLDPNHELVHIVAGTIGDPPALLNEGLATHMQVDHKWDDVEVDCWCESFNRAHMLLDVGQLLRRDDIGSTESRPGIAYPEAGSFVGFLIEKYGWDRFRSAYKTLKSSDEAATQNDNVRQLEMIYGRSLKELETGWLKRVERPKCQSHPSKSRIEEIAARGY